MLRWLLLGLCICVVSGCGSAAGTDSADSGGQDAARTSFGDYPADTSARPAAVVESYVDSLSKRDGERFCSVVAHWISGRFDLSGSDPDAGFRRQLRCPTLIAGFIGYIEDCCPPQFISARIKHLGKPERRGSLLRIPLTTELTVEEDDVRKTMPLDDVVWLVQDKGAWRVAELSRTAAAASIALDSEPDFEAQPDPSRSAAEFASLETAFERRLSEREASYLPVESAADCSGGVDLTDATGDIRDYQHPAPPTPTPQPPSADLTGVSVRATTDAICVRWQFAGDVTAPTTVDVGLATMLGTTRAGQHLEVELRADGKARIVGGRDLEGHEYALPGRVGVSGSSVSLILDRETFTAARKHNQLQKYRPAFPPGQTSFTFGVGVTKRLSPKRLLNDYVGQDDNSARFSYPSGVPCGSDC